MSRIDGYVGRVLMVLVGPTLLAMWGCEARSVLGPTDPLSAFNSPGTGAFFNTAGGKDCTPSVSQTEVRDGVVLSWEGSFTCAGVPDNGNYEFTINVRYVSGTGTVTIEDALLVEKTPKPRRQVPAGGLDAVVGLPFTLDPGQEKSFTVSGSYGLVQTDEGKKASFHFEAPGNVNGERFVLGFNGHFRAPGVTR